MKTIVLFCTLFLAVPLVAAAEQYAVGNHVVHTRAAPVIVHRVFPPYRGVHVYAGRNAVRR
jgi:hypothetical protein